MVQEENLNFVHHKAALSRAGAWPEALKVDAPVVNVTGCKNTVGVSDSCMSVSEVQCLKILDYQPAE